MDGMNVYGIFADSSLVSSIVMIIASWWPDLRSWPWLTTPAVQAEKPKDGRLPKPPRPNYNKIHTCPLPVNAYPLPLLVPHNPLSILHVAVLYLRQLIAPPPSHPEPRYQATWSSLTGTVHVNNEQAIRALWEKGFFGKGSLSRSEPTWLEREKRKFGVTAADTSEQWTRQRREERRLFKNERAKKEREAIEERLRQETREAQVETANTTNDITDEMGTSTDEHHTINLRAANSASLSEPIAEPTAAAERPPTPESPSTPFHDEGQPPPIPLGPIPNREHLQLSPVEAFFLTYALGVLTIHQPDSQTPVSTAQLLALFCTHSTFPPLPTTNPNANPRLTPSNPFLISYAVYHHFRSLGWVVRSGIKFGVDYLLYQRGPAFAHAQFSVIVVPSYSHAYWSGRGPGEVERGQKGKGKSWWWLHAVNRVQSQVLKNLVVVFVEVPPPLEGGFGKAVGDGELEDVTGLLKRYKVREMVLKRWTPNRTRD